MAPDLHHCFGANIGLNLLPVSVVELEGLDEALMLVVRPALASFGQGVRLARALAALTVLHPSCCSYCSTAADACVDDHKMTLQKRTI